MPRPLETLLIGTALWAGVVGCHSASRLGDPGHIAPQGAAGMTPAQAAQLHGGITPHTAADVAFMSGEGHHRTHAVTRARWAASNEASPAVRTFCDRVIVSQTDEIK